MLGSLQPLKHYQQLLLHPHKHDQDPDVETSANWNAAAFAPFAANNVVIANSVLLNFLIWNLCY